MGSKDANWQSYQESRAARLLENQRRRAAWKNSPNYPYKSKSTPKPKKSN